VAAFEPNQGFFVGVGVAEVVLAEREAVDVAAFFFDLFSFAGEGDAVAVTADPNAEWRS
jgi:hypothetical protein